MRARRYFYSDPPTRRHPNTSSPLPLFLECPIPSNPLTVEHPLSSRLFPAHASSSITPPPVVDPVDIEARLTEARLPPGGAFTAGLAVITRPGGVVSPWAFSSFCAIDVIATTVLRDATLDDLESDATGTFCLFPGRSMPLAPPVKLPEFDGFLPRPVSRISAPTHVSDKTEPATDDAIEDLLQPPLACAKARNISGFPRSTPEGRGPDLSWDADDRRLPP